MDIGSTNATKDFDFTCYGEILWDVLPSGEKPGGAPMNVAYHLKMLGHNPAVITRIGNDEKGAALLAILHKKGIPTTFVQRDAATPTGIVHATPNERGEMSYEIVEPAAWDNISWSDDFGKLFASDSYLVFGSLICRNSLSKNSLYRLLELSSNNVLDINLRPPHYDRELISELLKKAHVVKLNSDELELIAGWYGNFDSTDERAAIIQDKFDVPRVVVTLGGDGAMMSVEGKVYRHPGFDIVVADTVGSGDAFLAGLLSATKKGQKPEECLSLACAMGAYVTSKKGAWPDYDVEELRELRLKSS